MDNRFTGIRVAAAMMMLVFLLAVSAFAMAEADPIRVSSLSEPQSVISEQDVSITIKIYNSSQQDMTEEITLFDPDGISVDKYSGLMGEQSVTYTGTWRVTSDQISKGRINYYIRYTVDTGNGPTQTTRTVPVTIQTEEAAPQLTATYSISPAAARTGQQVKVAYTLSNTGNIELRNISVSNSGISDKTLTAAALSVGEKVTLEDSFAMGTAELVSQPTVTYQAAGESRTLTVSDMARRTITVAEDGLEVTLEAKNAENVYPGESVQLTLNLKNSGDTAYSGLSATLEDGTVLASGVELAPGASYDANVEYVPAQSMSLTASVSGRDANGEEVTVASEAIEITTQDASGALILDVQAQAQTTTIYSEPAVVRFGIMVSNIGQTDATTLTVQEAGVTVATIPSLPAGESRQLVFDVETSIAGQIQFTVTGKDAQGIDRSYASDVIRLTYIEPTPEPTIAPEPTAVPPTPSPEPTATPVPSIIDRITGSVDPIVLYVIAGVLLAGIAAAVSVSSINGAKRKKRLEQGLDTIEVSTDMRDSFGRRRKKGKKGKQEKRAPEQPIVPTPELTEEERVVAPQEESTMTPARDAMQRMERDEGRRRRTAQEITADKTLRVAPVDERPEFVAQRAVDDSQTRVFARVTLPDDVKPKDEAAREDHPVAQKAQTPDPAKEETAAKPLDDPMNAPEETAQETIRLNRVDMEEINKRQILLDAVGAKGKKRQEIKPMKKKKKGLFGGRKQEDDDFVEEVDPLSDDDDFFE